MTVPRVMHSLILVSTLVASFVACASATTSTVCPNPCKCFTNDHGIQAANCTDLPDQSTAVTSWPQRNLRIHFAGDHRSPVMLKNKAFRQFARLTYLDVTGATVQYVGNAAFDGLPELVELNLVGVGLRKLHRNTFASNRKLAFLSLKRNPRLFVAPSFLVSESVTELDLSQCGLTSLKSVYFAGLPNLKYLFAARNELRTLAAQFGPPGLKYVNLAHNRIEHVADDLDAYKRLRTVDLTGNPVNCTCELSEVDRKLTGRGVAFGNTIACANMAGKPLGDMAEACDGEMMMGDDPDAMDMYKAENLLKLDDDQQMRLRSSEETDDLGSGSGSGDDELIVDTAATRRTETTTETVVQSTSTTTAAATSTPEPAATSEQTEAAASGEQTEPASSETTTTEAAVSTEKAQVLVQVQAMPTATSDSNNSSGIVPQTIQAPEDGEQRSVGEGDVQTKVAEYLKTNVGLTGTAIVLAVVIFAIIYKAVCVGKKHRRMNGRGPSTDQKPAVELKEIKYMAADTEDSHQAPPRHVDSPADSVNLLASGDEDDDSGDDDDDDSGEGSPQPTKLDNGMLDSVLEAAKRSSGGDQENGPTRVIVKLGETPKASKPVAINNVH